MCVSKPNYYILSIPVGIATADTLQMIEKWNDRARRRMKEIGETQNTLSEKLDMTQGGLQHWLAGTRQPSLEDINRIAQLLRCEPAWLTHGLEEGDLLTGMAGSARGTLRHLVSAERANPLPASFWQAVASMVQAVAPAAHEEGGTQTPTGTTAPRDGTHG
jgi:transcriptional regulator with XRE-family HTH domain